MGLLKTYGSSSAIKGSSTKMENIRLDAAKLDHGESIHVESKSNLRHDDKKTQTQNKCKLARNIFTVFIRDSVITKFKCIRRIFA